MIIIPQVIFNGDFTDPWAEGEERGCKLTFIGKNLDKGALQEGFDECLATEENKAKRAAKLRFKVGDEVECNLGFDKWRPGKVTMLFWRDKSMPPGMTAPYQIELDNGDIIWAPADEEEVIRNKSNKKAKTTASERKAAERSSSSSSSSSSSAEIGSDPLV